MSTALCMLKTADDGALDPPSHIPKSNLLVESVHCPTRPIASVSFLNAT